MENSKPTVKEKFQKKNIKNQEELSFLISFLFFAQKGIEKKSKIKGKLFLGLSFIVILIFKGIIKPAELIERNIKDDK